MDLATLISVIVSVFLIVTMLSIGMLLAGQPGRTGGMLPYLGRVALVSLVVVPLVAIALARLFALDPPVALALLALGIAPAGTVGPKLVHLAGGDLRSAVVAAFGLSAVATLTVAPTLALTAPAVGVDIAGGGLDASLIIGRLAVFQLAPLVAGLAIGRRRPDLASRIIRPCTRVSSVLLVVFVILAVVDGWPYLLALDPWALLAALLLVVVADLLGWLAGGPTTGGRRAGLLITGQRSTALALLVVGGPEAPATTASLVAMGLLILVVNTGITAGIARVAPSRLTTLRAVASPDPS